MAKTISGKAGKVQTGATPVDVADVASWSITISYEIGTFASSSTSKHKDRVVGVGDSTGTIKVWQQDDVAPGLTVGAEVAVVFDLDGTNANKYTGSIVIESFDGYDVDMDTGGAVSANYKWGQAGKLTAAGIVPALT